MLPTGSHILVYALNTIIGGIGQATTMNNQHPNDPLHGVTLENILTELVEYYGWDKLGRIINIRCFNNDPSIKSSLQFLRRTPWARSKVEDLYLRYKKKI